MRQRQGVKIRDEEVRIRPTTEADLEDLLGLWNDGRVMKWVGFPDGLGYDSARVARWFARLQETPHRRHFVVVSSHLGFCGEVYYAIDDRHRAGLDIKLRPEVQGGGRAAAALRALIERVFAADPEVEAVWTEPSAENLAARTLYWSCGLRPTKRPADLEPGQDYWEKRRA
jgi:RimJ/RimL family protein N-acetyltransferase